MTWHEQWHGMNKDMAWTRTWHEQGHGMNMDMAWTWTWHGMAWMEWNGISPFLFSRPTLRSSIAPLVSSPCPQALIIAWGPQPSIESVDCPLISFHCSDSKSRCVAWHCLIEHIRLWRMSLDTKVNVNSSSNTKRISKSPTSRSISPLISKLIWCGKY